MGLKVLKDWTGHRTARVTVLRRAPHKVSVVQTGMEHKPTVMWVCKCDCGYEWTVPHTRISVNAPASCVNCAPALRVNHVKLPRSSDHTKRAHPNYGSWYSMIRRCTSPKHENYHRYGGRGITVCQEWYDFDTFVKDMGIRPEGKTLDRRDNDKGYCLSNCRWATPKEQSANTRPRTRKHR